MPYKLSLALLCCIFAAPTFSAETPSNLLSNGDFEKGAQGWRNASRKGVTFHKENGKTWLAIEVPGGISQTLALDPQWAALRVSARMKTTNVVPGKESWQDARLAMQFVDAAGKRVDPWPNVFHAEGTTEWVLHQRTYSIPEKAAALEFSPSMLGASGTVEFDDIVVTVARKRSGEATDAALPAGAPDCGDLARAWRQASPTRETICLNGLWRFLPATPQSLDAPPGVNRGWNWFKVPGIWPKSGQDAQQVYTSGDGDDDAVLKMEQAWYQRPLTVPAAWAGRRILIDFTMVQTHVKVLLDSKPIGEIFFPGGLLDITNQVQPGKPHLLQILLTARPLEKESNVFMAPDRIITSKAMVRCKGLTGDVFLVSQPAKEAIADVHVITSTRKGSITFDVELENAAPGKRILEAKVLDGTQVVKNFRAEVDPKSAKDGRLSFSGAWADAKLWDLHTPQNLYSVIVTLKDRDGKVLDESLPVRFGFREFWIDGRDFYLNGSRVHLRALYTTNVWGGADQASTDAGQNTCRRLKEYGFNSLITSAYAFGPGEVGYLDGIFNAADSEGVLTAFTLPHAKDYNWKLDKPEQAQRYRDLCRWLVRRAQNHPSIVLYSMNHNSTGYRGDQNPLWMDGRFTPEVEAEKLPPAKSSWVSRILHTRREAQIAADIARSLDPTRPVYHHQSGSFGDLYTVNIYLNWAPPQERSDWLENWSQKGIKPMFFVEWGLPHISSWSSFRGPEFIWRFEALQQIWDSEYAAPYIGEAAYVMTPTKVKSMAWEEELWSRGKPFYWSHLIKHLKDQDENYTQVQALFAADNWRSHRAWGISAMLPWDQENLWRVPKGAGTKTPAQRPFEGLQQPGIVADRIAPVEAQYIYSRDIRQIKPSALGEVFLRWNTPLCAFTAGDSNHFTEKSHNVLPGESLQKQLVMLNDTREKVTCRWSWSVPTLKLTGTGEAVILPGDKASTPISLPIPAGSAAGNHVLSASFDFSTGVKQQDSFTLHVLAPPAKPALKSRIAVYDPKGRTAKLLRDLGVVFAKAEGAQVGDCDLLVIGQQALTAGGKVPGLDRLAGGLKMLIFEQDPEVLTGAFGFRINVHGLRRAFVRTPNHPALAGLSNDLLRDWRGASTLTPPYLDIQRLEQNDPKWSWCGFENTRVWRCGNWGNVASVLIEKPEVGDYTPLADGGFDLQYAPLLEQVLGKGRAIFCQLDVTGRTADDPAAKLLCTNLLRYLDAAPLATSRKTVVAGDDRTASLLRNLHIDASTSPAEAGLLILGPGAAVPADLSSRVEAGLNVLCLGLGESDLQKVLREKPRIVTAPAVSGIAKNLGSPALAGISNADLHWRTQPIIAAMADGTDEASPALRVIQKGKGQIILCQAAPWMFDYEKHPYLRTTYRRSVFLVNRLLHNLGAASTDAKTPAKLYLQTPLAGDDPYRYYRW